MVQQKVRKYQRKIKGKMTDVCSYDRTKRKKDTPTRVLNKPVRLYPIVDTYGRRKGFSSKPPPRTKAKRGLNS